jgi:hypothetical protein
MSQGKRETAEQGGHRLTSPTAASTLARHGIAGKKLRLGVRGARLAWISHQLLARSRKAFWRCDVCGLRVAEAPLTVPRVARRGERRRLLQVIGRNRALVRYAGPGCAAHLSQVFSFVQDTTVISPEHLTRRVC